MTGRPPRPIGTHGKITTVEITPDGQRSPRVFEARTRVRDPDGVTRRVKRTGGSKAAAENALQRALSERRHDQGADLGPDTRVRVAAEAYLATIADQVAEGELAPNTLRLYESTWRNHVEPALGDLRLRELTVARCEAWKQATRKAAGASVTKTARSVLSGVAGYATRLGALPSNPVRDLSTIRARRKREARAMTLTERVAWLDAMAENDKAVRWAIPDLTRFMLATGVRIGEATAVTWDEVDLDAGTVAVRWHIVRVKGEGLLRAPGAKSEAGDRVLALPQWATAMLLRRRVESGGAWPVFPDSLGGWRDPSNLGRVLRECRDAAGFSWVTSHVFRQTVLTVLDDEGLSARTIANVAGHSDPTMTQRNYMARRVASDRAAAMLETMLDETG